MNINFKTGFNSGIYSSGFRNINFSGISGIRGNLAQPAHDTVSFSGRPQQEKRTIKAENIIKRTFETMNLQPQNVMIPEGIKRSEISDDELQKKLEACFEDVCSRLKIKKEQRPDLIINFHAKSPMYGGGYMQQLHGIFFNAETYRQGLMEMERVLMHEGTHCAEALKRAGIPQKRADLIVKNELISRIKNGETLKDAEICDTKFKNTYEVKIINLPDEMKEDYIKFAEKNLYIKDKNLFDAFVKYRNNQAEPDDLKNPAAVKTYGAGAGVLKRIIDRLKPFIDMHPEFSSGYEDKKAALDALLDYSISHYARYIELSRVTPENSKGIKIPVQKLSGIELEKAEKSLADFIKTFEASMSLQRKASVTQEALDRYYFDEEEITADINGNNYLIEQYSKKLAAGNLEEGGAEFLKSKIQEALEYIEFRQAGRRYMRKKEILIENPDDENLRQEVLKLQKEAYNLNPDIRKIRAAQKAQMQKVFENAQKISIKDLERKQ